MTWDDKPFGIRITDQTGRQWARLRPDSELQPESIGAWLAGYRAALTTFLSSVPKEERPIFQVHVDVTWEINDVDESIDIIRYEETFSKVFNAF